MAPYVPTAVAARRAHEARGSSCSRGCYLRPYAHQKGAPKGDSAMEWPPPRSTAHHRPARSSDVHKL